MNRALAWRAVNLALPVVAAYVCLAGVMGFEIWAVGSLGPEAVAGVGLGSWLFIVLLMAFHALEIGCQTIVARRFGEKRWTAIGATVDNSLFLALAIGVGLTVTLHHFGPVFLHADDPLVRDFAVSYFQLRILSLAPLLVILALIGFYNGIGKPYISLVAFGSSTVVNVVLIYALVFGHLGFHPMGVEGAAMASVISVLIGSFLMVLPLVPRPIRSHFALFRPRHLSLQTIRSIVRLSTPIFVQNLSVHIALFLFIRINAWVGTVALAATNVVITVANFSYLPAVGFGVAAATLVSQSLGGRNPQRARMSALICVSLGALFMVGMGVVFIAAGRSIMEFYIERNREVTAASSDVQRQVIDAGTVILRAVGLVQIFDAMGLVFSKALQGAGLTRFVMYAEIFLYWAILLPATVLLGLLLKLGVFGTWGAFVLFLISYGLIMLGKFRRGDWVHVRV